ncbi:MAG: gliding motility-associated protein GldE [Bacteroidetes bacterium]|nr:MAG: gliding motility-associated protein GldE [Bacteroidota bacterium]
MYTLIGLIISLLVLLLFSALISGSEVAFFSLTPVQLLEIEESENSNDKVIQSLLINPKKLLATILIANNFVNIAIVVLSTFLMGMIPGLSSFPAYLIFLIQVVGVTFLILLFGEVLPKVYATNQATKLTRFMAAPMLMIERIFSPFSYLLIHSTSFIDKKIKKNKESLSVEELEHAFELTEDTLHREERKILKSIVRFGNTDVKQIMTARTFAKAFEQGIGFEELLKQAGEIGYSRIPIYEESFDIVIGILYLKDLLPFIDRNNFDWKELLRKPFFVPENKKIDDLLKEFQRKKVHLAIVVDEYGGTSGIVTLEDILEEIVGEITDEFDDEEIKYSKLDDNVFIFDGATSLIDIYKVLGIEGEEFEEAKGEADSIAGFIIEQAGIIPQKGEKVKFENYEFTVMASDKRKVKQIQLTIIDENEKL